MVKKIKIILGLLSIAFFISSVGYAAVPIWNINGNNSSINFTATQNGGPVSGRFPSFKGTMTFDPTQLDQCNTHIVVDVTTLTASFDEITDTLKSAEWFDIAQFPSAVFDANTFKKTGDNTYSAEGKLTIRDKTLPVTINFTLENFSPTTLSLKGDTTIQRTKYGIGQGDWEGTDEVKDDVTINFTVSATA